MKLKNAALLTRMVKQYEDAHQGRKPEKIVVEPLALVALGIKRSVAPIWQGVQVECREIEKSEVVKPGRGSLLGVILDTKTSQVVACDLSSANLEAA